jgi:hypothetical protein
MNLTHSYMLIQFFWFWNSVAVYMAYGKLPSCIKVHSNAQVAVASRQLRGAFASPALCCMKGFAADLLCALSHLCHADYLHPRSRSAAQSGGLEVIPAFSSNFKSECVHDVDQPVWLTLVLLKGNVHISTGCGQVYIRECIIFSDPFPRSSHVTLDLHTMTYYRSFSVHQDWAARWGCVQERNTREGAKHI